MLQELTFGTFDAQVLNSSRPVVVDFWSPSCGPCGLQEGVLKNLANQFEGEVEFRKVNVWDEADLAVRFQISAVPTLIVFNQGQPVQTLVGYQDQRRLSAALQRFRAEAVALANQD